MTMEALAELSPHDLPDDVTDVHVYRQGSMGIVTVTVHADYGPPYPINGKGATVGEAYAAAMANKAADARKREAGLAWKRAA